MFQPRNAVVPPTGDPSSESRLMPATLVLSVVTAAKFALSLAKVKKVDGLPLGYANLLLVLYRVKSDNQGQGY